MLPYFTRGSIESAYLGMTLFPDTEENIVFLDNDVMYTFPEHFFEEKESAFLGYSIDNTGSTSYSFLQKDADDLVTDYKEKKRISNLFCCGVYGFRTLQQFKTTALHILKEEHTNELYLSILFQWLLQNKQPVKAVEFKTDIFHIGSYLELKKSWDKIEKPAMRVCFDLDNTLVTYPTVPNDYSTVKPIPDMISLAQKLHSEGHTIIIHTARRMKTHKYNVGAVCKDIGMVTFLTLEKFNIPYDELLFGKPIADIYIDDRAVNPYKNDVSLMGYLNHELDEVPLNALPSNKLNRIRVENEIVVKNGPTEFIKGEIYFYQNMPIALSHYFPEYYGCIMGSERSELKIEYIKGITFYSLYQTSLLTNAHLNMVLQFVKELHNITSDAIQPGQKDIESNYITKLEERFACIDDYPFDDAHHVQKIVLDKLSVYCSKPISIVPYIHGDLWFSNIILTYTSRMKVLDMKGKLHSIITTCGDCIYDYAKLYQSLLGFDSVLYNHELPHNHSELKTFFEENIPCNISLVDIKTVTFSLVIGTMHAISKIETKTRIWNWMKHTFL
jgi:capsule biosynthesis phosphatase